MEKCGPSEIFNFLIGLYGRRLSQRAVILAGSQRIWSDEIHLKKLPTRTFRRGLMGSLAFFTGALTNFPSTHTFERPIQALSSTTALQQLTIHEVITFLTNLGDHFHIGRVMPTRCMPYTHKSTIFCRTCSEEVPVVLLNTA
jgi:hypothetical protein